MEGRVVNGRIRTEFVPFACRSYQQLVMPLHEETTQISLEEAVKSQIFRRGGRNILPHYSAGNAFAGSSADSGEIKESG